MITLLTTAETVTQGKALIDAGADQVIVGEKTFGLRIPGRFTFEEMTELADYAHERGAEIVIAANAILHNEQIEKAREFLSLAKATGADYLLVGDTGLIQILKDPDYYMPYIYDAATLVASSGQINFWSQFGAKASFVAREVPFFELERMADEAVIPLYYQVYGATCIHHSRRYLLENYFNYMQEDPVKFEDRHLALTIRNQPDTHYAIYEDHHGTHIFSDNDLDLLPYLNQIAKAQVNHWYLDGVLCPSDNYVEIVRIFNAARQLVETGEWNDEQIEKLDEQLREAQPDYRDLDTGFFLHEPGYVK